MIAMALVHNPDVLIADEPTTALDVTVQAQILELIDQVKREFDIGVILITHDLGVVAETRDTRDGHVRGPRDGVRRAARDLQRRRSTRTRGACSSRCRRSSGGSTTLVPIEGSPPSLLNPPPGCPFHPRCTYRFEPCDEERPPLERRCPAAISTPATSRPSGRRELWTTGSPLELGRALSGDATSAEPNGRRRSSRSST